MPERPGGHLPIAGSGSRRDPPPGLQIRLEPCERLTSELDPRGLIGWRFVPPSAAAGQRGDAGRVVDVLGPGIVAEPGVVRQRLGKEPGRYYVPLLLVGPKRELKALGVIRGRLPLEDGGQPMF